MAEEAPPKSSNKVHHIILTEGKSVTVMAKQITIVSGGHLEVWAVRKGQENTDVVARFASGSWTGFIEGDFYLGKG